MPEHFACSGVCAFGCNVVRKQEQSMKYPFRTIVVAAVAVCAVFGVISARVPEDSLLRNRTIFLATDFAGFPVYTGTAAINADVMFNGWLGVRGGIGTSYAMYGGIGSGFAVGLKLMSPPVAGERGRLEVVLGGSYMSIREEGSAAAANKEWRPLVALGSVIELTERTSSVVVFGRAGLGILYYYGLPFYIGWGVAF